MLIQTSLVTKAVLQTASVHGTGSVQQAGEEFGHMGESRFSPTTEAAAAGGSGLGQQLAGSLADPPEGGCSWDPLQECQIPASGSLE